MTLIKNMIIIIGFLIIWNIFHMVNIWELSYKIKKLQEANK